MKRKNRENLLIIILSDLCCMFEVITQVDDAHAVSPGRGDQGLHLALEPDQLRLLAGRNQLWT